MVDFQQAENVRNLRTFDILDAVVACDLKKVSERLGCIIGSMTINQLCERLQFGSQSGVINFRLVPIAQSETFLSLDD